MARAPSIETVFATKPRKGAIGRPVTVSYGATGSFGLVADSRSEAQRIELALPFPPSLNNLFLNVAGRGRVPSSKYTAWLEEVAWLVAAAKPGRVGGKVEISLAVGRPDARRRDLDNLLKAPIDAAVKNRLISDDSLVERVTAYWAPDIRGVVLTISKHEGTPA